MEINGIRFTHTKLRPNGRWVWVTNPTCDEIIARVERRLATASETRVLNRMNAANPPAMTLPGVHPSYRI